MRAVSKKEWEKVPKRKKKVYDSTPYMVYTDIDGSLCFGPVRIIEEDRSGERKTPNETRGGIHHQDIM